MRLHRRAGALYCQCQMFISAGTVSGIAVASQMVFAALSTCRSGDGGCGDHDPVD